MTETDADQADVDESVARHLERALDLREELGQSDERSAALAAGSERDALRARVQLLSNRIYRSHTEAEIESAVLETRSAAEAFDALDDDVGLAEAAIAVEYLEAMRGHLAESTQWCSIALRRALAARRPRETILAAGDLLIQAIVGPLPFDRFAANAEELLSLDEPVSGSTGHALVAVAALAAGDDPGFREHEGRWREVLDRHGLAWLAAADGLSIAIVEISVGKADWAERRLREAREFFVSVGNVWYTSIADEFLCEAVGAQDRPGEFLQLADAFTASAVTVPDRQNLTKRQVALARTHLLRGAALEAEVAARRALELVASTDLAPDHANALLVLADVLDARDLSGDATVARAEAIAKLRAKGNLAAVALLGG